MNVYGIVEECIHASALLPKERPPKHSLSSTGISSEAEEGSLYPRTPFLLRPMYTRYLQLRFSILHRPDWIH
jgi:hypothetical protein